jgi:hypothetical protein
VYWSERSRFRHCLEGAAVVPARTSSICDRMSPSGTTLETGAKSSCSTIRSGADACSCRSAGTAAGASLQWCACAAARNMPRASILSFGSANAVCCRATSALAACGQPRTTALTDPRRRRRGRLSLLDLARSVASTTAGAGESSLEEWRTEQARFASVKRPLVLPPVAFHQAPVINQVLSGRLEPTARKPAAKERWRRPSRKRKRKRSRSRS